MLQSHYIPLESPYRIIYAGGALGMQIGTLLVVHELEPSARGGNRTSAKSRFATESHPVVSYINKGVSHVKTVTDIGARGLFSEGVVWDKVTQDEVATVCLEDQELSWKDCLDFLGPELMASGEAVSLSAELQRSYRILETFAQLGGKVVLPDQNGLRHGRHYDKHCGVLNVELSRGPVLNYASGEELPCLHSPLGGDFLFVAYASDTAEALALLDQQRNFYERVMSLFGPQYNKGGRIQFTMPKGADDEELARLGKMLNQQLEKEYPSS